MWWAGPERVVVYVGAMSTRVAPAFARAEAPAVQPTFDTAIGGFEAAMEWIADDAARHLDVQLSGALARPFVFEAVKGLKTSREAHAVAATLAPEATGLTGPCSVWLDEWVSGQRCVAVAVETSLRDGIEWVAREHGLRIKAMRPWWSLAMGTATAQLETALRLLVVEDTDSLTVLTSTAGSYTTLASYAPRPDAAYKRAVVTRAAMTAGVAPEEIALVSMGDGPESNGVDVPGGRPRPTLGSQVERWL